MTKSCNATWTHLSSQKVQSFKGLGNNLAGKIKEKLILVYEGEAWSLQKCWQHVGQNVLNWFVVNRLKAEFESLPECTGAQLTIPLG